MTVAYHKFNCLVADMANKVHNLGSDQLSILLLAAANAPVATNAIATDLTVQVSLAYLVSPVITTTSCTQTSGTLKLILVDKVLTASGGSVGPFRYVVIYNSAADGGPLICWFDYGADITLLDGETLTVDFDGSAGVLQLA